MIRGFTFLELLLVLLFSFLALTAGVPSFQSIVQTGKMTRLATDIQGFMFQARAEAITRNQDLWAHIIIAEGGENTGQWSIQLTDAVEGGELIALLSGSPYKNINIAANYTSNQISFDGINGKAKSGNLTFSSGEGTLKFISFRLSGRMRICGDGGDYYGYKSCS
ncbi:pilus assembly protein FimT [Vibrio sp. 10N.286.49.B3]|nr:pilus assembly protein FimT [Vibrio sp. 10N.286.49.B3]